jgi:hypothetical protein
MIAILAEKYLLQILPILARADMVDCEIDETKKVD